MDWWLALVPLIISIGVIYFTLCEALRYLFLKHSFWFIAVVILIAPFSFVLAQVSSLLELVWVLALTPFYGVYILSLVATTWIIRFYCSAYAVLIIADFLLKHRAEFRPRTNVEGFESYWKKHLRTSAFPAKTEKIGNSYTKVRLGFSSGLKKSWTLSLAAALLLAVAFTFVSANVPRNTTYIEAIQFISEDRTDNNLYVTGEYVCANFSADFQSNALKTGLNCGVVTVFFADGTNHALNAFNTTDMGLVYVEPQTDQVGQLTVGEVYFGLVTNLQSENTTIAGFSISWNESP